MNMALTTPSASVGMQDWQVMQSQATTLLKSGFLPKSISTPEQAVAIILQGRELGIPAMAALGTINVIQGKPTVSPQLMLALIYRSGQLAHLEIDSTETSCGVRMDRKGIGSFLASFDLDDAKRLGLADKDNWRKQPRVMLKWRAVAACAREGFADVVLGLYTPEEMGANVEVSDDGEMQVLPDPIGPNAEATRATLASSRAIPSRAGSTLERFAEPDPDRDEPEHPPQAVNTATVEIIEAEVSEVGPERNPRDRMPTKDEIEAFKRGLVKAKAVGLDPSYYALESDTTYGDLLAVSQQMARDIKRQEAAQQTLPV